MNLDIKSATEEVLAKSDADLELETAAKWAARAVACFKLYDETSDMKWLLRADSYQQEALEHAALVRDGGESVALIDNAISEAI